MAVTFEEIRDALTAAFRAHSVYGVPASGDHEPLKSEIRAALLLLAIALEDGGFSEPPDWASDLATVLADLESVDASVTQALSAVADALNIFGSMSELEAAVAAGSASAASAEEARDLALSAVADALNIFGSMSELDAAVAAGIAAVAPAEEARDLAQQYAADAAVVSGVNVPIYSSMVSAAGATIAGAVTAIRVQGVASAGDGNEALFKAVGSEPAHLGKFQSVGGQWWEYVPGPEGANAKVLGVKADGTTDDGPAINSALTFLSGRGGGRLRMPPGTTKVATQIALKTGVHIDIPPEGVVDVSALAGSVAIQAQGTVGSSVALTANASRGAVSVSVAAGAESAFAAGDYVQIISERRADSEAQKDGEFQIVKSVSSGGVTLLDGLWGDYATTDTASIRKMTPVSDITISGGGAIRGAGTNDKLLTFFRCANIHVRDIRLIDGDLEAIAFQGCVAFSVTGCDVFASNNSGTGYGLALYDCSQWGSIVGNTFRDCRHGVSGGGNTGGYGLNRFINIQSNSFYGCRDAGVDAHSPCQYWNIIGNTITADNGLKDGITWQGLDAIIALNQISGPTEYGVLIEPRRPEDQRGIRVVQNNITRPGLFGIYLIPVGSAGVISGTDISDNAIFNPGSHGIMARTNVASRAFVGLSIDNNKIFSPGQKGVYVLSEAAAITTLSVAGNLVNGSGAEGVFVYANTNDIADAGVQGNKVTMTAATDAIAVQTGASGNFNRLAITDNVGGGGTHGIRKYTGTGTFTDVWVAGNAVNGSTARIRGFSGAEVGENQGLILFGSTTYDPVSLADGAGAEVDVTVTGAAMGDYVDQISFSVDTQGILLNGQVTAVNTVTVRFQNETGGTIDLASGTIRIRVRKLPTA